MSGFFPAPELGPNTLTPRPYQIEAVDAAREALRKARSTCVILPTGMGKTVLFALIARYAIERGRRVLILAHRTELISQAADTLERVGVVAGVEQGESYARSAFDPMAVVAMVQTLKSPKRLASWPRDHFPLIIIDECHHATAETYQRIIKHFAGAKVVGVTATPDRADDEHISDVFESVAYELNIWDAMTAPDPGPYLCPLRVVRCETEIDLRGLSTTKGGDFNVADLEDRITPLAETLANAIRDKIGERQTLVFTPDCGSASAIATALQALGLRADYVWGDSPDREAKVRAYKQGDIQILCNCALFTEGFDAPATSAVVLARPTKSRSLYAQMVGRGTRLSPGKSECLLIDFAWLTRTHELVRPSDLFDRSDQSAEVAEVMDELIREAAAAGESVDVVEATKRAKEEASRREALRIKARVRETRLKWVSYNADNAAENLGVVLRGGGNAVHDPASTRQIAALEKFGIADADKMSRRRATKMLDVLVGRAQKGLASMKQVSWLIARGIEPAKARAMSRAEASEALDGIFAGSSR